LFSDGIRCFSCSGAETNKTELVKMMKGADNAEKNAEKELGREKE
jgi:hypothetical protein